MKLHPFQTEDFARAAMTDGAVLSLEQGLGKSFAAFCVPYIWRARRTLIVAPVDLHDQIRETAARHFGIPLPVIRSHDCVDKYRLHIPAKPLRKGAQGRFFLIGYEALTRNGADEWPPDMANGDNVGKDAELVGLDPFRNSVKLDTPSPSASSGPRDKSPA